MKFHENTTPQEINLSNPAVELGNSSIHDAYALEINISAKNETGSAKVPTIQEFLSAFEQIAVMSDNTRYHYALTGLDIARRNAMTMPQGIPSRVLDKTFTSVADDATMSASFVLTLDEGDLIALQHDTVTLKAAIAKQIAVDCPVTACTINTTIFEKIPESVTEIVGTYGANFERALEPKVYAMEKTLPSTTEFTGFFDLPTGSLLNGAMLHWTVAPSQVGMIQVVPSRSEIHRVNWATAVARDERRLRTAMPSNTLLMDYNSEWMLNALGKDGRTFNRGDYQIAAKSATETKLRYVSFEKTFPAGAGAVFEPGNRFL
ncbi:hypothetical protein [Methanorbis furvi]|uniref:Uncharacterized protein n=1 Tax=Methanorbis furvi TaxID=3028299 RepID=A0AAE4ME98_9EURY|nr:hypothetical protein [Methanocorpusculaceae archaeon Ag1]